LYYCSIKNRTYQLIKKSKKMKKVTLIVCICILAGGMAFAQKFKPKADFLKGQTEFSVVFDFSGVTFDGDKEADYVKERLADQSTAADKEKWEADWKKAPKEWMEWFRQDANNTANGKCRFKKDAETEYTINIKVKDIDPGNFAGPFSNPAKIDAVVTITKTGNSEVLTTAEFEDVYSAIGLTPIESHRIKMSFGRFGDEVCSLILKAIK